MPMKRMQLRHTTETDKRDTRCVLLDVSLDYVLCFKTFGTRLLPRQWPMPFTKPLKHLFRVATWIPVALEMALWLCFPSFHILIASSMSFSVQCCNVWSLWALLGFHLILCSVFLALATPFEGFDENFFLTILFKYKVNFWYQCLAWCLGWGVMSHSNK